MKRIVLLTLVLISLNAHATWPAEALSQQQYQQASGGSASTGSVSVDASHEDKLQIPTAPPAIAPSQSINAICQISTPQSNAVSFLFFSASQTTGVKYNALCIAQQNGDAELVHQLACDTLPEYKAANAKLGRECK